MQKLQKMVLSYRSSDLNGFLVLNMNDSNACGLGVLA